VGVRAEKGYERQVRLESGADLSRCGAVHLDIRADEEQQIVRRSPRAKVPCLRRLGLERRPDDDHFVDARYAALERGRHRLSVDGRFVDRDGAETRSMYRL
jgi:hypothetical protein